MRRITEAVPVCLLSAVVTCYVPAVVRYMQQCTARLMRHAVVMPRTFGKDLWLLERQFSSNKSEYSIVG
jgi:hypothetical protein